MPILETIVNSFREEEEEEEEEKQQHRLHLIDCHHISHRSHGVLYTFLRVQSIFESFDRKIDIRPLYGAFRDGQGKFCMIFHSEFRINRDKF